MRLATILGAFVMLVFFSGIARPQPGDGLPPVPPGSGLFAPPHAGPLINDTNPRQEVVATESARFSIVLVRDEAILLDTTTGATWHLVFLDLEAETRLYWQSVPKDLDTCRLHLRSEDREGSVQKTAPSEYEPGFAPDPFPGKRDR